VPLWNLTGEGYCSNDGGRSRYQYWATAGSTIDDCKAICESYGELCVGITVGGTSEQLYCHIHTSSRPSSIPEGDWQLHNGGGDIDSVVNDSEKTCYVRYMGYEVHPETNCGDWNGGAKIVYSYTDGQPDDIAVWGGVSNIECASKCNENSQCTGFSFSSREDDPLEYCYLKQDIKLSKCSKPARTWDMYTKVISWRQENATEAKCAADESSRRRSFNMDCFDVGAIGICASIPELSQHCETTCHDVVGCEVK